MLTALKPEVCFNALHGEWGEDGCVQGVLETLGLRYTHSGVPGVGAGHGQGAGQGGARRGRRHRAGGGLYNRFEAAADHVMPPPYVVKPNAEGSSVGVFIVSEGANRPPQEIVAPSWTFGEEVMIEPYIRGKELAVGVMDGKAMTVTDIIPRTGSTITRQVRRRRFDARRSSQDPAHAFEKALRMSEPRTRRLVAEGLPGRTFVMTTLTTFWSSWRSIPNPA